MEFEGKTVDEAIEKAVQFFEAPQENLNIEVVTDGSQGLFGLIGSKKARIKAINNQTPEEQKKEKAKKYLEGILSLAEIPALVTAELNDKKVFLNIKGDGSGLLIGKRGQTLDALQYIVSKMVNRKPEERTPVIVDTENYRQRREAKLTSVAQRLGERVKRQRISLSTELFNPQERRVIYLALQNYSELLVKSEGEGKLKRVIISPRNHAGKA